MSSVNIASQLIMIPLQVALVSTRVHLQVAFNGLYKSQSSDRLATSDCCRESVKSLAPLQQPISSWLMLAQNHAGRLIRVGPPAPSPTSPKKISCSWLGRKSPFTSTTRLPNELISRT